MPVPESTPAPPEPPIPTPTTATLSQAWILCHKASKGDLEALREVLAANGDLNVADYDLRTPLHLAAAGGHLDVVRFLVEEAHCPVLRDRFGSLPTDDAQRGGHTEIKRYLCGLQAAGNDPQGPSETDALRAWTLCHKAHTGDLAALRKALEAGQDLSIADYDGRTALHLAAASGHLDVVRFLVKEAHCPMLRDRFGSLPADDALRGGHLEVRKFLMQIPGSPTEMGGSTYSTESASTTDGHPAVLDADLRVMPPSYIACAQHNPALRRVHARAIATFCGPDHEDATMVVQHRFSNGFVVSVLDTQNTSGRLLHILTTTLPTSDATMHAMDVFSAIDDTFVLTVFHYCHDHRQVMTPSPARVTAVVRFSEEVQLGEHLPEFHPQPDYSQDKVARWVRKCSAAYAECNDARTLYRLHVLEQTARTSGSVALEWCSAQPTLSSDLPDADLHPGQRALKERRLTRAFWVTGCAIDRVNPKVSERVCKVFLAHRLYIERAHSQSVWGEHGPPTVLFRFLVYPVADVDPSVDTAALALKVLGALRPALLGTTGQGSTSAPTSIQSPSFRPTAASPPGKILALDAEEDVLSSGNDDSGLDATESSDTPRTHPPVVPPALGRIEAKGELQGELWKQNQRGVIRLWQKRRFELSGTILTYTNPKEPHLFKSFDLQNFTLAHCDARKFAFSLVETNHQTVLKLAANSEPERRKWWSAIAAAQREAELKRPRDRDPEPERDRETEWEAETEALARYQRVCLLGRGTSGKVWKVRDRDSGELLAMKVMDKGQLVKLNLAKSVMSEKGILETLRHPFVIRLHGAFQTSTKLFLVLDYYQGGTLQHLLEKWTFLQESLARFYATEIALALSYLHTEHIIHRDVKPTNVLLNSEGHAIVTDFGIATSSVEASTFCGTPHYIAPEILSHRPYTKAVDWWCFGVLLYQMLTGTLPFLSQTGLTGATIYRSILEDSPSFDASRLSSAATSLLQGLLTKEPEQRLAYDRLVKHPFFSGVDWDAALKMRIPRPFLPPT